MKEELEDHMADIKKTANNVRRKLKSKLYFKLAVKRSILTNWYFSELSQDIKDKDHLCEEISSLQRKVRKGVKGEILRSLNVWFSVHLFTFLLLFYDNLIALFYYIH